MEAFDRRADIVKTVEREGYVQLRVLSRRYDVAPVTIYRDLDYLVAHGRIQRVRGGARANQVVAGIQTDYSIRSRQEQRAKERIAERAIDEIPPGGTVFFDSSTTVEALAHKLEQRDIKALTLVTNSPAIVFRAHMPFVRIIAVPGMADQSLKAITGRWAEEFLDGLSFQTAFASCAGLTVEGGMMTTQRELADVIKAAFRRSERKVALVDSGKFDKPALTSIAALDEVDVLFTDDAISASTAARYRKAGLDVVISAGNDDDAEETDG